MLEDLPALVAPYHEHLRPCPDGLSVHPHLLSVHTELMRHLGLGTEQNQQFLRFAEALQRCSRSQTTAVAQDPEPTDGRTYDPDNEEIPDWDSAPIRTFFDSLEDGGE